MNDVHTLLDFVQRGLGVAIVPRPIAAKPQAQGLVVKAIVDPRAPRWSVGIATPAGDRAGTLAARLLELVSVPDPAVV
nr:LysR family transcriptional regulator substrate-binding protein [Frondihabitans sucicola]